MAWENSRNYVTSPLVFPRNDIWKTSAESFWSVPNNHSNSRLFSQVDIKSGMYWFEEEPRVLLSNIVREEKFLFGIPFNIKMNQESAWYHFEGSRQSWKSLVPRPYTARSMRRVLASLSRLRHRNTSTEKAWKDAARGLGNNPHHWRPELYTWFHIA